MVARSIHSACPLRNADPVSAPPENSRKSSGPTSSTMAAAAGVSKCSPVPAITPWPLAATQSAIPVSSTSPETTAPVSPASGPER